MFQLSQILHIKILESFYQSTYLGTTTMNILQVMLGLLCRTFSKSLSISAKKLLYISLVRSQLIYGSPIWRPFLIKDIKLIEQIQCRAIKFILNDFHSDYCNRLVKLQFCQLCICSNCMM